MRVKRLKRVYHVGSLSAGPLVYEAHRRNRDAYEGTGLSVTTEPEAWTAIAKLGGRVTFILTRRDGAAGAFAVVSVKLVGEARRWGVRHGLLRVVKAHQVCWENEDGVIECFEPMEDREAAHAEAAEMEHALVRRVKAYFPTQDLGVTEGNQTAEVMGRYLFQKHAALDGLWWNDVLDVSRLSAPRGVILPHALPRWGAR